MYKKNNSLITFFIVGTLTVFIIISCKKSNDIPPCNITDTETGPLFKKTDSLITTSCAGSRCHTGGGDEGGYSFDTKCEIVDSWNAIYNACVIRGNMPPSGFNNTQKTIITNWVNAGHQASN